jgi:hypothetical protein
VLVILHHQRTSPLWEGEAPAEPKSTVSVQLSLFVDIRSPSIPDAKDKNVARAFLLGPAPQNTMFFNELKSI